MNTTCVIKTGCNGFLVSNVSRQNDLPTSIAASILEYGVFLLDIIPHKATLEHSP